MSIETVALKAELEFLNNKISQVKKELTANNNSESNIISELKVELEELINERRETLGKLYALDENLGRIEEVIYAMNQLGLKGFVVGDVVSLTSKALSLINESDDGMVMRMGYPDIPTLRVVAIEDDVVIIRSEDDEIEMGFNVDSINDLIVLTYRANTEIPDADDFWNKNNKEK